MKECPRCLCDTLQENKIFNSLSRRDNTTYICSTCEVEEALIDVKFMRPTINEKVFIEEIFDISYTDYSCLSREDKLKLKSKNQIRKEMEGY